MRFTENIGPVVCINIIYFTQFTIVLFLHILLCDLNAFPAARTEKLLLKFYNTVVEVSIADLSNIMSAVRVKLTPSPIVMAKNTTIGFAILERCLMFCMAQLNQVGKLFSFGKLSMPMEKLKIQREIDSHLFIFSKFKCCAYNLKFFFSNASIYSSQNTVNSLCHMRITSCFFKHRFVQA